MCIPTFAVWSSIVFLDWRNRWIETSGSSAEAKPHVHLGGNDPIPGRRLQLCRTEPGTGWLRADCGAAAQPAGTQAQSQTETHSQGGSSSFSPVGVHETPSGVPGLVLGSSEQESCREGFLNLATLPCGSHREHTASHRYTTKGKENKEGQKMRKIRRENGLPREFVRLSSTSAGRCSGPWSFNF